MRICSGAALFMSMLAAAVAAQEKTAPAPPEASASFTARGNEPGWSLEIDGDRFVLQLDHGAREIAGALPKPRISDGTTRYVIREEGIEIGIADTLCSDDMTGMPHPKTVELKTGEQVLRGCGGDPRSLLVGQKWQVEQIAGEAVPDDVAVMLRFLDEDRIAGSGGCNRFMGEYSLSGEGFSIGKLASTMMACPEPQMAIERRFLDLLEAVVRFGITPDGALVLVTSDGRKARARR